MNCTALDSTSRIVAVVRSALPERICSSTAAQVPYPADLLPGFLEGLLGQGLAGQDPVVHDPEVLAHQVRRAQQGPHLQGGLLAPEGRLLGALGGGRLAQGLRPADRHRRLSAAPDDVPPDVAVERAEP